MGGGRWVGQKKEEEIAPYYVKRSHQIERIIQWKALYVIVFMCTRAPQCFAKAVCMKMWAKRTNKSNNIVWKITWVCVPKINYYSIKCLASWIRVYVAEENGQRRVEIAHKKWLNHNNAKWPKRQWKEERKGERERAGNRDEGEGVRGSRPTYKNTIPRKTGQRKKKKTRCRESESKSREKRC